MRLRATTTGAVLLASLWLACGDDYHDEGPLTGEAAAACFADGTCKTASPA